MVMSQVEDQNKASAHWLMWLEGISIAGGLGGAIASGQMALMTVALPVSAAAALNLINRQRLLSALQRQTLPNLELHERKLHELKQNTESLVGTDQILMIQLNNTNNKLNDISAGVSGVQEQVDGVQQQITLMANRQSELMESTLEESYYRRGLELEKRGEFKDAIAAYTEALRVNPDYAQAYLQLGTAYAYVDQKQQAIAHLRTATKLFFERGDLEQYHLARHLSEEIHAGTIAASIPVAPPKPEPVEDQGKLVVDELFV